MRRPDASVWRGEFFGGESAWRAMKRDGPSVSLAGPAPWTGTFAASGARGGSCCAAIVHSPFDLTGLIGRWQLLLPVQFP
jgi:hypothetical protein